MTKDYTIKYSKRKTMGLYITRNAEIEVRVPNGTPQKIVADFVNQHQQWISTHHGAVAQQVAERENFELKFGAALLFLGHEFPLEPVEKPAFGFDGQHFYAYAQMSAEELRTSLVGVYRTLAKKVLSDIVEEMAKHMGLKPKAVKINAARSRWGSCSSAGNLNFSWYLVMAEEATIRYVVVHELAHLIEMNHSPNFWRIVEQVLPNYKAEREKLKKLQKKLSVQCWE
ncbi:MULTISPECIES: M48 family metallopeptidase [Acetobacterium]|uniref:M48 family metallopeptidase n=1 Tax=Acetobacterium TaxID=33951 RepID=UPI0003F81D50|nr:SprT family zinc-dependent metalloprotease [Acetobacterium dehalogenans]